MLRTYFHIPSQREEVNTAKTAHSIHQQCLSINAISWWMSDNGNSSRVCACVREAQMSCFLWIRQEASTHQWTSRRCSASSCRRRRARSCFRSSFLDLEATLRANSLCFSSLSLCREEGGREKMGWDVSRREREERKKQRMKKEMER